MDGMPEPPPAGSAFDGGETPTEHRPPTASPKPRWRPKALKEATGPEQPGTADPPRLGRRFLTILLGALALLSGGVVLGWWIGTNLDASRALPSQQTVTVEVPAVPAVSDALMPDLRGIEEQSAREILGDVGVDVAKVKVTTAQAAGPVELVVSQSPAAGSTVTGDVTLVVSSAALVPKLEGVRLEEAQRQLSLLGAEAVLTRAYRAGSTAGTVLAVDPPAGKPLPSRVSLTIADASSSVYIATVDSVVGGCRSGEVEVNGTPYAHAVTCSARTDGSSTAWVISRLADSFTATVGVPDSGDPAAKVRVTVRADGRTVGTATAAYGKPARLAAKVTGALRLEIIATALDPDASTDAVLGDARLVGGPQLGTRIGARP